MNLMNWSNLFCTNFIKLAGKRLSVDKIEECILISDLVKYVYITTEVNKTEKIVLVLFLDSVLNKKNFCINDFLFSQIDKVKFLNIIENISFNLYFTFSEIPTLINSKIDFKKIERSLRENIKNEKSLHIRL